MGFTALIFTTSVLECLISRVLAVMRQGRTNAVVLISEQIRQFDLRVRFQIVSHTFSQPECPPNGTLTAPRSLSYVSVMIKILTTKTLETLKPATGKRYEVRDAKTTGLIVSLSIHSN